MNYEEEIKKHEDAIRELKKERDAEARTKFPKIEGKYFRSAAQTYDKVLSVEDYDSEDNEAECDCLRVVIEQGSTSAYIDSRSTYCTVRLDCEVSKEVFDAHFQKAIQLINAATE